MKDHELIEKMSIQGCNNTYKSFFLRLHIAGIELWCVHLHHRYCTHVLDF
jgi:uncharacterized protein YbcV (DUF1398 family)